ncbi:WUSCHEL-related homeobox 9-like [Telopea speciosissima]|uniref:WUSCHEL-related homeobox 9-like n=1 Tax=Telopea speciosissima TaxID=54955 RepID=UPI001CC5C170|nr:WUSCHEL-related homeobox 9-like [Telopea speciosissima]
MASSNRHWPSMFKSKPCNTHHQWQHDINPSLVSSGCQRNPHTSVPGSEDKSPEPKPRWNPKPEQIRILEAIFNSGMVNPPRDEIRKIRAQLQEFGQVGDANVFYWFQNRKSRSKHKQRHLQTTKSPVEPASTTTVSVPVQAIAAPSSSSSSSSEKSPPRRINKSIANQSYYFQPQVDLSSHEPFFFPVQPHEISFSEISNLVQFPDQSVGPCSAGLLLSELMNQGGLPKKDEQVKMMKVDQELNPFATATTSTVTSINSISPTTTGSTTLNHIHGGVAVVGEGGGMAPVAAAKTMVFINDVAFEVGGGGIVNVREAFGDDAILINSSGQPILTNEFGVTLQSLQHGGFYYVVWENGRC